ncbi:MAG TPA: hypothetical protein VGL86_11335 [Polyangia bacterium]
MRTTLAFCVLLLGVAGCGDDSNNGGPDMSMPPDLAPPPDMSLNGVACGASTICAIGQECCVTVDNSTGATSASCISSGGTCTGGAVLACDGPEDCTSSQFCCGMITFNGGLDPDAGAPMFNGGNSSCAATCDFNLNQGPPTQVTTRLCHFDTDCTGLTAFGQNLDKCCSSTMAPGLHFCAEAIAGITCP